jgi:hypothetical protein
VALEESEIFIIEPAVKISIFEDCNVNGLVSFGNKLSHASRTIPTTNEPGAPVIPGAPVEPVEPVAPSTPIRPAAPVAPVKPAGPIGPPFPCGPTGPCGPGTQQRLVPKLFEYADIINNIHIILLI